jgi:hypothetical protein
VAETDGSAAGTKVWWQSNTIRLGLVQVVAGALTAYLNGEETRVGALVVALIGILQIVQREISLRRERHG